MRSELAAVGPPQKYDCYIMKLRNVMLLAFGTVSMNVLAATDVDKALTSKRHWQMTAKDAAAKLSQYQWDVSGTEASMIGDDLRLFNRDIEKFAMQSRSGQITSFKALLVKTTSREDFSESLEDWKIALGDELGMDGVKSPVQSGARFKWRFDDMQVILTAGAKGKDFVLDLEYRPKNTAGVPASVAGEKDRYDGIFERSFYSTDYSKSFKGTLKKYSDTTGVLTVETAKGALTKVNLDDLSERDAQYIENVGDLITALNGLALTIKEVKEKPSKVGRAITVNTSFDVTVSNRAEATINNLDIRYKVFYKRDTLDAAPVLTQDEGSWAMSEIYGKYRETVTTEPIDIVRETSPSVSGG